MILISENSLAWNSFDFIADSIKTSASCIENSQQCLHELLDNIRACLVELTQRGQEVLTNLLSSLEYFLSTFENQSYSTMKFLNAMGKSLIKQMKRERLKNRIKLAFKTILKFVKKFLFAVSSGTTANILSELIIDFFKSL